MNRPASRIFGGRNLLLGGSTALVAQAIGVYSGDISGIAAATMPRWSRLLASPPREIASLPDWTEKIACLTEVALTEDIRSISGTPSWLLLFFDQLAARYPDRRPALTEFFSNLGLIVHGGVNFAPYRARFGEWLAGSSADLREAYPASEGFIAAADRGQGEGLRLMLDNGIFYGFVPVAEIDAVRPQHHWIGDIEVGVDYAIVVTTCAGLWAYAIGNTVRCVARSPPRLPVTGRLSYTLSAFGEHLAGKEIEAAVVAAAGQIRVGVRDFAGGALFPKRTGEFGGHLLIIEFERPVYKPEQEAFTEAFDRDLAGRNLDYQVHRAGMHARPRSVSSSMALSPDGCAAAAVSAPRTRCPSSSTTRICSTICKTSPARSATTLPSTIDDLWLRPLRPRAEQAIPDGDGQQDGENPNHEKGRVPCSLLRFATDTDHDAGDLIGIACLGAPEAVAIGLKDEFALGVGVAGQHRIFEIPRCEHPHLGIGQWLAVLRGELRCDLVRAEETEGSSGELAKPEERGRYCQKNVDRPPHQQGLALGHGSNIVLF